MGYPYNSPIDEYFKGLSPEFIADYNISDIDLGHINEHKRATESFDTSLYSFAKEVSTFIQDYDTIKTTIVDDYETQIEKQFLLEEEKITLETNKELLEEEFIYMDENRDKLDNDLLQAEELITYYKSQLMTNTIVDVASYIENANSDILIIDDSLAMILNAITHYSDTVETNITSYISDMELTSMYSFEAVLLKETFEAWLVRPEDYYKKLIEYYQSDYDAQWSAGQSIMYDKNNEYVEDSKNQTTLNATKLSSEIIKQYKFTTEKNLKLYTIEIVDDVDMDPEELQNKILDRHISYLKDDVAALELIISDKQYAIDSVISYKDFLDYNKYKELIQLKRHYIATNITIICDDGIEAVDIGQYDALIAELVDVFTEVENKLTQLTYWTYYYDHFVYDNTLIELKHELDILELTRKGTINAVVDIAEIESKILFYENVKIDILEKIQTLITVKDAKTIDKIELNDNITLLNSNIFATQELVSESILRYASIFSERIKFYFQNEDITEYEGIKAIISKTSVLPIETTLDVLNDYTSVLRWWDAEDKVVLFDMYNTVSSVITSTVNDRWNLEFNHPINRGMKIAFYKEYLQTLVLKLYATMIHYTNYKIYSSTIESELKLMIDDIMFIANDYTAMASLVNETITLPTTFYDYAKITEFDVSEIGIDKTLEYINGYLMNNYSYISEINLEYKVKNTQAEEDIKINAMWENMEIKYV